MDYLFLSQGDLRTLTRERVRALEADHFRLYLTLTEATGEQRAVIEKDMAEVERRIAAHVTEVTDTPDAPATTEGTDPLTDGDETDT